MRSLTSLTRPQSKFFGVSRLAVVRSFKRHSSSTIDQQEILKFEEMSNDWWNPEGKVGALHQINPIRVKWIREVTCDMYQLPRASLHPFSGLRIADIGCGGGLLSECLSRLGGSVTGIDASPSNIRIATQHLHHSSLSPPPLYQHTTAESLALTHPGHFDVVCSLEVIEHVHNVPLFVDSLVSLLKPNGLLFVSTINKTLQSYLLTILLAEDVLGWVKPGTHQWNQYIEPDTLKNLVGKSGVVVHQMKGLSYNPNPFATEKWYLSKDLSSNYFLVGSKKTN
eukprot:TRINITY_DN27854_c0_g1_i1.p1 TRINITY_DN27854_c0_g1~~TRINITY_DN27854_c0_g1_i1.p1  ORF type:complete len:281 (-),score=59.25 TRINITY_DN27854_c0_g1_i1:17-859(-)